MTHLGTQRPLWRFSPFHGQPPVALCETPSSNTHTNTHTFISRTGRCDKHVTYLFGNRLYHPLQDRHSTRHRHEDPTALNHPPTDTPTSASDNAPKIPPNDTPHCTTVPRQNSTTVQQQQHIAQRRDTTSIQRHAPLFALVMTRNRSASVALSACIHASDGTRDVSAARHSASMKLGKVSPPSCRRLLAAAVCRDDPGRLDDAIRDHAYASCASRVVNICGEVDGAEDDK